MVQVFEIFAFSKGCTPHKKYLPKNADLLRVINLVYEQSEIIIREDQEQNENFLILIYVKDQDDKQEIIVEDKIKNFETNISTYVPYAHH